MVGVPTVEPHDRKEREDAPCVVLMPPIYGTHGPPCMYPVYHAAA